LQASNSGNITALCRNEAAVEEISFKYFHLINQDISVENAPSGEKYDGWKVECEINYVQQVYKTFYMHHKKKILREIIRNFIVISNS